MPIAVYVILSVLAICGLTWVFGRALYPIPVRFEGVSDEPRDVEQRFRNAEGE